MRLLHLLHKYKETQCFLHLSSSMISWVCNKTRCEPDMPQLEHNLNTAWAPWALFHASHRKLPTLVHSVWTLAGRPAFTVCLLHASLDPAGQLKQGARMLHTPHALRPGYRAPCRVVWGKAPDRRGTPCHMQKNQRSRANISGSLPSGWCTLALYPFLRCATRAFGSSVFVTGSYWITDWVKCPGGTFKYCIIHVVRSG